MTQFNAHQPEQNSKADLVDAWKIAVEENQKQAKRIEELEQENLKCLGWIGQAMVRGLSDIDCGEELVKIAKQNNLEQQAEGYEFAITLIKEAAQNAKNNDHPELLSCLEDLEESTGIFNAEKQITHWDREVMV